MKQKPVISSRNEIELQNFYNNFVKIADEYTSIIKYRDLHCSGCIESYYKDLYDGFEPFIGILWSQCNICYKDCIMEDMFCPDCAGELGICLKCGRIIR